MTGCGAPTAAASRSTAQDVTNVGVQEHFDSGLGHMPEDRQRRGLVLEFSIAENIAIHDYRSKPDSRFGWLSPRRLIERAAAADPRVRRARRRAARPVRAASRAGTSRRSSSPARSTATRRS